VCAVNFGDLRDFAVIINLSLTDCVQNQHSGASSLTPTWLSGGIGLN